MDRLFVVASLISIVLLLHVVRRVNFGLSHLVFKVKLLVLDTLLSIWGILLVRIVLLVNRWLLILIWILIVRLGNAGVR